MTTGLYGKYFEDFLSKERYQTYLKTYPIAENLGFPYNLIEEKNMRNYLAEMYVKGKVE